MSTFISWADDVNFPIDMIDKQFKSGNEAFNCSTGYYTELLENNTNSKL